MGNLRKIFRRVVSRDAQSNRVDNLGSKDEYHKISDQDGALESLFLEEKHNCDCGCFGPLGGRCAESGCGRISCIRCHRHCGGSDGQAPDGCGKPICREHSHYLQLPEGKVIVPFCRRCYGRLVRKGRWLAASRTFLSFLIDEGEQNRE